MTPCPCPPNHHRTGNVRTCPSCAEPYCAEPSCLRPTCWDCGATLPDPDATAQTDAPTSDAIPAGALEAFAALLELVGSCGSVTFYRCAAIGIGGGSDPRPIHFSATVRDPAHVDNLRLQPWEKGGAHWFGEFRGWPVMGYTEAASLPRWEAHVRDVANRAAERAQNGRAA